jgi:branched-chain amino acid transport system ATP-binding protein
MEASEKVERSPGGDGDGNDVLVADSLTKIFGGLVAVDSVSFVVPRRSIVSIIGPNGAGKTTFFNMLTGLYRPNTGRIAFNGQDITRMRPDRIMAAGLARTFQNIRLFGTMSAVENVMVALHVRTKAGIFRSMVRTPGVRRARSSSTSGSARACSTRCRATSPTATSAGSRLRARSSRTR